MENEIRLKKAFELTQKLYGEINSLRDKNTYEEMEKLSQKQRDLKDVKLFVSLLKEDGLTGQEEAFRLDTIRILGENFKL